MTWHLLLQEGNWYLDHVQPQDGKRAARCLRKVQKCGVPFFSRLADTALLKVNGGSKVPDQKERPQFLRVQDKPNQ